jgi:hypothetical protein
MSLFDSPDMSTLLWNIRTIEEIFAQDPEFIQDVKFKIERQIPQLQDQGDTLIRSIAGVKPNIDGIIRRPDVAAMIRSNSNINIAISPEFIQRAPQNAQKKYDLFLSNLAARSGGMNYSFGMRYNNAANILFHYVAIPSADPTTSDYIIYDNLKESRQKLIESISQPLSRILRGCEPQCTATTVYNKISPFVIWELVWEVRELEHLTYMQELDLLMLHNDIPIIGAACGEVFLSMVTDREIPRSDRHPEILEKMLSRLSATEDRIKKGGFLISPITTSINLVPYPVRELAAMGLLVRHNGEIKSFNQVLKDLTQITNEQFITNEKLQNKKQVLDSLLKSFIHRIKHPDENIYKEYQNIVSVRDLAQEFSITRHDINRKMGRI